MKNMLPLKVEVQSKVGKINTHSSNTASTVGVKNVKTFIALI